MPFLIVQQERRDIAGHEFTGPVVVGRGRDCDICIRDSKVSRQHCVIEPTGDGGWRVRDLGSRNGVVIRGKAVTEATLSDGDRFWLGREIRLRFGAAELPRRRPESPAEVAELMRAGDVQISASRGGAAPRPQGWVAPTGPIAAEDESAQSTGLSFAKQRPLRPPAPVHP
jgi:pSer/pThr/pTyr-binding forkhead associated (FHA) protein